MNKYTIYIHNIHIYMYSYGAAWGCARREITSMSITTAESNPEELQNESSNNANIIPTSSQSLSVTSCLQ